MASSSAHVRADVRERHSHHVYPSSSSRPVKPAQFAFTISGDPSPDSSNSYVASQRPSLAPAPARLDVPTGLNGRTLVRSLSAQSLSKTFSNPRIASAGPRDIEDEGMNVDELQSILRGWSFEKGNVKAGDGNELPVVGKKTASTRVYLSPSETEPPSRHDPQPSPTVIRTRSLGRVKRHPPLPKESVNFRATLTRAQTRLEPQRTTAYATMAKERRSLQSILIPSFLHSPPQSAVPTPTVPTAPVHSRKRASVTTASDATGEDARSPEEQKLAAARPSIKSRARAQTYTAGSASRMARASTKASVDWSWPHVTTRIDEHGADTYNSTSVAAGRESPSSYLLDDDPFASVPTNAPALSPTSTVSSSSASVPVTPSLTSPLDALPPPHTSHVSSPSTVGTSSNALNIGTDRVMRPFAMSAWTSPTMATNFVPPSPLNPKAMSIRSTPTSPIRKSVFLSPEGQSALPLTVPPIAAPSNGPPSASANSSLTFSVSHSQASSSRIQLPGPRPAHTRPAFTPRPSLPSLSTLARMDIPVSAMNNWPVRVRKRKGKVGAGLPLEPWDEPIEESVILEGVAVATRTQSSDPLVGNDDVSDVLDLLPDRNANNATPKASVMSSGNVEICDTSVADLGDYDRVSLEDALNSSIIGSSTAAEDHLRTSKELPPIPSNVPDNLSSPLKSEFLNIGETDGIIQSARVSYVSEMEISESEVHHVDDSTQNQTVFDEHLDSFLSPPSPEPTPHGIDDGPLRLAAAAEPGEAASSTSDRLAEPGVADTSENTREGQELVQVASNPFFHRAQSPPARQWSAVHDDAETLTDALIVGETKRVAEDLNGEALRDDDATTHFTWLRAATSNTSSASSPSPSLLDSPHSSLEDEDYGVELSGSPSFYTSALQHLTDEDDVEELNSGERTRPESLLLDPFLSSTSNSSTRSSLSFIHDDPDCVERGRLSPSAELHLQQQLQQLETERAHVDEDDSSTLPPLSTLPEDDPLFSLTPSRQSAGSSDCVMAMAELELPSKAGLNSIEYARRLLAAVKQRHGMHASVSSSGSGSAIEDLGLRRYESSPSPPTVPTSSNTSEDDVSHVSKSSPTRAAPKTPSSPINVSDIRTGAEADAEIGWRPFDEKTAGFEPGSSASTLRPSSQMRLSGARQKPSLTNDIVANWRMKHAIPMEAPPQDPSLRTVRASVRKTAGSGENSTSVFFQPSSNSRRSGRDQSSESDVGDRRPSSSDGGNGGYGRETGGAGDEDEDENDKHNRSATSSSSSSRVTSDSESSDSEDDYGVEATPIDVAPYSQRRNGRKGVFRPPTEPLPSAPSGGSSRYASTEEDNVPLAQRIPRALEVQQSIRRQVRDERERRKRGESRTSADVPATAPVESRGRSVAATRVPLTALNTTPGAFSNSQEAAIQAMQKRDMAEGLRRARSTARGEVKITFPADDLTRRLLKVQAQTTPENYRAGPHAPSKPRISEDLNNGERYPVMSRTTAMAERVSTGTTASAPAHRSNHITFSPTAVPRPHHSQPPVDTGKGLRHMRSFHQTTVPHSTSPPMPISRHPSTSKVRTSAGDVTDSEILGRSRSIKSSRPSIEEARAQQPQMPDYPSQPPVPPLPSLSAVHSMQQGPTSPKRLEHATQTRIFVGDLQRFNMVEIGPHTNAKDVLDIIRSQGDLSDSEKSSGGWMVFELNQDFGLERPLRNFELLSQASNSWDREKTTNAFIVKRTPLALPLSSIPASLPQRTGYVEYEIKKGKWGKRWLELREHGLWLSKRQGKDDEFLCSLSAFDAYILTRPYKAPYSFTFAVKSTERISLFENKSDYLHVFACPVENGMPWVEAILLARSYILYQEKHVLFKNRAGAAVPNQVPTQQSAALSRSNTRARQPTGRANPPFLSIQTSNFNAPSGQMTTPFEKGSLLAKRTADGL